MRTGGPQNVRCVYTLVCTSVLPLLKPQNGLPEGHYRDDLHGLSKMTFAVMLA